MIGGEILHGDSKTGSFDPDKEKIHTRLGRETGGQVPDILARNQKDSLGFHFSLTVVARFPTPPPVYHCHCHRTVALRRSSAVAVNIWRILQRRLTGPLVGCHLVFLRPMLCNKDSLFDCCALCLGSRAWRCMADHTIAAIATGRRHRPPVGRVVALSQGRRMHARSSQSRRALHPAPQRAAAYSIPYSHTRQSAPDPSQPVSRAGSNTSAQPVYQAVAHQT